ncbi:MAG TPA: AI-2E family transporter [Deltaproteobacteria bacterium]|nr:AI-2E family transporter [Deltaproteobacteria bacterium]HPJ93438.1 AI-2E family transporter [Deltaproteobacteria bacterium]HPR51741.1 AI-2E family transporter [Deltaproteobacteria bacterium]
MFDPYKPITFDRIIRIAIALGLIVGLVALMGYLSDVLIPFAIALLLAYLINPMVLLIQKKIPNRVAAVFISLFLILFAIALVAVLVIPMIAGEITRMGQLLSSMVDNAAIAARARKTLPPDLWLLVKKFASRQEVLDFFASGNLIGIVQTIAQKILPGLWGFISGTASFLLGLLGLTVILLYLVFLLFDFQKLQQEWENMIPGMYRRQIVEFVKEFNNAMNQYFRGQAAVASIVGVLFAIGFVLIGLPLGILLGLFIGLLNMVPYLQLIGLVPAFLLALVHALEAGLNIWVTFGLTALVFVVVQTIQDTFLVPKIMGKVTGLSPAMILLSLSVWGKLLGFFGLVIAIPVTCLILAYYRRLLAMSETKKEGTSYQPLA